MNHALKTAYGSSASSNLAIVAAFDPKTAYGYPFYLITQEIQRVFKKSGVSSKIYNFQERKIPEKNILFVGTCHGNILTYLTRFLPDRKVVLYGTLEGFPMLDPNSVEREVAEQIKIVAFSEYSKMCMESSEIHCDGVVYPGIDMEDRRFDKRFAEWIMDGWAKAKPIVLTVVGNMPRKGVDKFMIASKLVHAERDICFILHSGGGSLDVRGLAAQLQLNDFWYTNSFGMYPPEKLNALYHVSDVYVQPSHCEGFGMPMIEAIRFLRPVVAVDAQPYSEIVVNGKTGLLVPCKGVEGVNWMNMIQLNMHQYSVDDLADNILKLLSGKRRIKMKKAIARRREKFDSKIVYPKLLTYLEP